MVLKINFAKPIINNNALENIAKVIESGRLSHGPFIDQFESEFAKYTGSPGAVSVSSCTTGLNLCYSLCGVGPDSEVIVPALTHVATAHAAAHLGAKVRFADVNVDTGNIDIDSALSLVNEKTVAVAVVHFLGNIVDVSELASRLKKINPAIKIIEDCAVALGSRVDGTHVGLLGDYGCFSFYPSKHITTGEGGMIISKSVKLLEAARKHRSFGYTADLNERKIPGLYDICALGYNYRMPEISAAIGVSQMDNINELLAIRKRNYEYYEASFGHAGYNFINNSTLSGESIPFLFNLILSDKTARNDVLVRALKDGVQLSVHYPIALNASMHYFKLTKDCCPNSEFLADRMVSLPTGPHISLDEADIVIDSIKRIVKCES